MWSGPWRISSDRRFRTRRWCVGSALANRQAGSGSTSSGTVPSIATRWPACVLRRWQRANQPAGRRTIELFVRGGELWERASWTTIGAGWGGLLVTRLALIGVATAIGAKLAASPTSIPIMLAITLGTQMLVERQRARAAGLPIAPSRRARLSSRRRRT